MKKTTAIIISLCLIFSSVLPVYAEAWTSQQATTVTSGTTSILSMLTQLRTDFVQFWQLTQSQSGYYGIQDIALTLNHINEWFAPSGARGSNDPTLLDSIIVLTNYAMNHLPAISSIAGYVSSWMSANNTWNNRIANAIGNQTWWGAFNQTENAFYYLFDKNIDPSLTNYQADWYHFDVASGSGTIIKNVNAWTAGTPLGNLARMFQIFNDNYLSVYTSRWSADLTHYNDTLSTWDSQGNTLTQVNFTPDSAIHGLYRYLAFTQRDVARLAYVLASDEEIEVREKARANQTEVLDDFVDPTGDGAVSASDFSGVSSASAEFKDNFNTGASASGVWSVFDQSYVWFSQTTADNLTPTVQQNNRSLKSSLGESDYDLSYLENQYDEIFSIIEGFNND